ncbi:hypothetical protein Bca52824_035048 [Brassica carinata]|uniref:Uncharacterized protein n=1 Tax=Brassica carinata TaxID=52824 RepID=A0A8X7V2C5_BRACI|nr:hypothetical protein Bca52824_035048 [Brassica carinata]
MAPGNELVIRDALLCYIAASSLLIVCKPSEFTKMSVIDAESPHLGFERYNYGTSRFLRSSVESGCGLCLRSEGMPSPSLDNLMVSPCFKLWLYIFYCHRDVDYRENRIYDEQSDYAGGLKAGSRIEFMERDERNKFLGYNNVLEEQSRLLSAPLQSWLLSIPMQIDIGADVRRILSLMANDNRMASDISRAVPVHSVLFRLTRMLQSLTGMPRAVFEAKTFLYTADLKTIMLKYGC